VTPDRFEYFQGVERWQTGIQGDKSLVYLYRIVIIYHVLQRNKVPPSWSILLCKVTALDEGAHLGIQYSG
jgi:hypothetical protein